LAERSTRHLAAFAVVVLAGAACLGLAWDSGRTGEPGRATIASAGHHQASPSVHLDGVLAIAAVAFAAQVWATQRISRGRLGAPVAMSCIRRRGPPQLSAY
jgi:hypothetical protein